MARSLGKAVRQFREAAGEVQRDIQESANMNLKDIDLNEKTAPPKPPTLPPVVTPPSLPKTDGPEKS